jgi:hypothetical protein
MKWMILLLDYWRNHTDYQNFMLEQIQIQIESNPDSFTYFSIAIQKMCFLSLDAVKEDFASRFSYYLTTVYLFVPAVTKCLTGALRLKNIDLCNKYLP